MLDGIFRIKGGQDMKWRKDAKRSPELFSRQQQQQEYNQSWSGGWLFVPWFLEELSKHEMSLVPGIGSFWLEMVLSFCAGNYAVWGSWCPQKKETLWSFVNVMGWTARMNRLCERVCIRGHCVLKLFQRDIQLKTASSARSIWPEEGGGWGFFCKWFTLSPVLSPFFLWARCFSCER